MSEQQSAPQTPQVPQVPQGQVIDLAALLLSANRALATVSQAVYSLHDIADTLRRELLLREEAANVKVPPAPEKP